MGVVVVKKLISSILKKPDKKGDVPDELPPIKSGDGAAETQKQAAATGDGVPDELPALGTEPAANAQMPATMPTSENEEAPAELPDIVEADSPMPSLGHETGEPAAAMQAMQARQYSWAAKPMTQQNDVSNMPADGGRMAATNGEMTAPSSDAKTAGSAGSAGSAPQQSEGFFSKLSHLLKSGRREKILTQNLLSTMKDSYTIKRESVKTGLTLTEEKRIKQTIDEILGALKLLEGKWRGQKMVLDEDERTLAEYEEHIKENERKLKKLLRAYVIYESASLPLVLKNCLEVRNISELYNALRTLDEKTYAVHTSKNKNDFADFAARIDKSLAAQLRKTKSKSGMIRALTLYIDRHKES